MTRPRSSSRMTPAEALALLKRADLPELMARADAVRRRLHGSTTHYVHSLNLNPTNVCLNRCPLCAFWRSRRGAGAYMLDQPKARKVLRRAASLGLTELHIVGGIRPEADIAYYESLLALCRRLAPGAVIQGLTAVEVDYLARQGGLSAGEVIARLARAGLDCMPGGGAEIFAPAVRRRICPDKISGRRWLEVHSAAHRQGMPTNATMLFGHVESPANIVDHLRRLRDLQDRTRGFRAFCPLPFHAQGTRLGLLHGADACTIVRVVAVSRLFLDNIPHVRMLGNYVSRKLLGVLLRAGVDDIGGTSLDERIALAAGSTMAQGLHSPEAMAQFVRELGLYPVLTNSMYEPAPHGGRDAEAPRRTGTSPARRLAGAIARARSGKRLSAADAIILHDHADLNELGRLALKSRRKAARGGACTFVIDRNINFTNVCVSGCRFCAFHVSPGDRRQFVLSASQVAALVRRARRAGATQVLFQGGLNPNLGLNYIEGILRAARKRGAWLHCLSPAEVQFLADGAGLSVRATLERLRRAGLDSLPGGGAEILVDDVRRRVSPNKISTGDWLAVMRTAHGLGMSTTATMVYGLGETTAQRIAHMLRIRELQDETGGFRAFIPWSYQSDKTSLPMPPQTGVDYLRVVAIARLVLDNVPHIQAGWVTEGADLAQLALWFGADDFGGVLMEEQVVRAASDRPPNTATPETIVHLIRRAGWRPVQRTTDYQPLRRY